MSETNTTTRKPARTPVEATLLPDDTVVTMYGAHKILAEQGLSVRPQMLYTYGGKGMIPTVEADGRRTTVRHLQEWADAYRGRKAAKATEIKAELQGK
jgi:hypothetical protein